MTGCPWACLLAVLAAPADPPARTTPEARAVAFLAREVPRWASENRCYSCHNNGDAARALYAALGRGLSVPASSLADTNRWLARPEGWDRNGGDGPFSDKRLARIQFTVALASAVEAGQVVDRRPLLLAARRLADEQEPDGSWRLDDAGSLGTPATYGRPLATSLVRDALRVADSTGFAASIDRAGSWLRRREVKTTLDASSILLAAGRDADPAWEAPRRRALAWLRRAQSDDGGWGPYINAPPEPFDTAAALLALVRSPDEADLRPLVRRGRAFLIAAQGPDGAWTETTRPPGAESYAQRLSTSGWATLALLATGDRESVPRHDASVPPRESP
jgi:hypothetical protein